MHTGRVIEQKEREAEGGREGGVGVFVCFSGGIAFTHAVCVCADVCIRETE